ncbi:MAG TPA: RNase H1/viroplasmin domain-containing protein [Candidatus Paceibacterota bacterium]
MSNIKYYAVASGNVKKPTIFNTWEECKKVTQGYKSKFKSFDNLEDAKKFIKENSGNTELKTAAGSKKKKNKPTNKKKVKLSADKEKEPCKINIYREIKKNNNTGSTGEDVVEMHLKMLGYKYVKEYQVNIDGYFYRFDFAIFKNNRLAGFIEFDGQQHFEAIAKFGGSDGLMKTQYRDSKKNNYCNYKELILLRIKYSDGHSSKTLISEAFNKRFKGK